MKARASHSRQKAVTLAFMLMVSLPHSSDAQNSDTNAADFFVATNGRDDWSGRVAEPTADRTDGPFATLTRARNAVRELKKVSQKKNLVVRVRGGSYLLRETLVFSLEDSAPNGGTITYAGSLHETSILTSGVPIRGWRKLNENLPGLPAAAQGKVWVADVPQGLDRPLSLYDGLQRLPRARTKGFTPPEFVKANQPLDQFRFPAGEMKNWPDLKEAELLVVPSCDYEMNILPITSVDEQSGLAKTTLSPSRPIGRVKYFDKTLWVENIIEALDQPGRWVSSAAQRKIYLWPKGNRPGDGIVAPGLTELVKVEGKIDYDGPRDHRERPHFPRTDFRSHRAVPLAWLHRLEFAAQLGTVRPSHNEAGADRNEQHIICASRPTKAIARTARPSRLIWVDVHRLGADRARMPAWRSPEPLGGFPSCSPEGSAHKRDEPR